MRTQPEEGGREAGRERREQAKTGWDWGTSRLLTLSRHLCGSLGGLRAAPLTPAPKAPAAPHSHVTGEGNEVPEDAGTDPIA